MIPDAFTIKGKVNMESASNVVAAGWASLIRVFLSIIGWKISLKIALKNLGRKEIQTHVKTHVKGIRNTCKKTHVKTHVKLQKRFGFCAS